MDWPDKPAVEKKEVPAKPAGIWTLVHEYVHGPALIRIEAEDTEWMYSKADKCKADGDLLSSISPAACILKDAPVGALIGKIGGSSAGISDGTLFVVGKHCIFELDPNKRGPLYLTINDELTGFENNNNAIEVDIFIKLIAKVPAASSSIDKQGE
jgi:hypothetical protein